MDFKYHPKLVEHMVRQTKKTVSAVFITSFIALLIYRNHIPLSLQAVWIVAQSLFLVLRYYNAFKLRRYLDAGNEKKVELHTRFFFYIMVYSAISWNAIVALGFIYAPDTYALFSYIMVSGLINGAVLSLSSLVGVYIVYFLLLLVPQIIYMFLLDGSVYDGALMLALVYVPYVIILLRLVNRNLVNEIKTNEILEKNVAELHELSITDPLTRIYNRRYFFQASESLIKISKRENKKNSLLMIDVDHFKKINDDYGHDGGDVVLISLAGEIKKIIRESDIFARVGGEEFAVFLYGSDLENAKSIGQKICTTIENHAFTVNGIKITVTVSVGVAQLNGEINTLELLYSEADRNLYEAKRRGRNRVC